MKTEIQRIINALQHTYEKNAWHGPSVKEALADVTEKQSSNRMGDSHSIIELVAHMTAWRTFVTEKLKGNDAFELTDEQNFTNEKDWNKALINLEQSQVNLLKALSEISDEKLNEVVPNRKFKFHVMLHGIIHHDLYHTGQIVLLKKATPNNR